MSGTREKKQQHAAQGRKDQELPRAAPVRLESNGDGTAENKFEHLIAAEQGKITRPLLPASDKDVAKSEGRGTAFKAALLTFMVVQNTTNALLGRYTRTAVAEQDLYNINHHLVLIESTKLIASLGLEYSNSGGKLRESLQMHVLDRPKDALKMSLLALLYLGMNFLYYIALSNLTTPIFQVTSQSRLISTALVSVVMLNRSYRVQQWFCLFLVSLGVSIVSVSDYVGRGLDENQQQQQSQHEVNLGKGLSAVAAASFLSAFTGVYFEMVIKTPASMQGDEILVPPSVWMRNIQLAFFSVVIALAKSAVAEGGSLFHGFFHGFTPWVWAFVVTQACGGLVVAAVIKHADTVVKGLATCVSVVLSSYLSMAILRTPLGHQFLSGTVIILGGVYIFSNPIEAVFCPALVQFS